MNTSTAYNIRVMVLSWVITNILGLAFTFLWLYFANGSPFVFKGSELVLFLRITLVFSIPGTIVCHFAKVLLLKFIGEAWKIKLILSLLAIFIVSITIILLLYGLNPDNLNDLGNNLFLAVCYSAASVFCIVVFKIK